MTRIDFHFNAPDKLDYACRLVRKIHRTGQRVVVWCEGGERLRQLDAALWSFSPTDFIPHVMAADSLAAQTPVVLASPGDEIPHHEVLVNIGDATPPCFASFERLIEVVTGDVDDRNLARTRFRFYKDRGYPMETHDLAAA
jgi:DNA polymerase III subunit chi